MDQNCVIPTQQSLEEMKRITMTVIDLDQSNFIPWGLGEEPPVLEEGWKDTRRSQEEQAWALLGRMAETLPALS